MGKISVGESALVYLVADQLRVLAAHEIGNHVRADGGNEHHENRAHNAAPDTGQEYPPEGEEAARAEIASGLHEREVELLRGRVDRHDGERKERVHRHHENGAGIVVERSVRVRHAEHDQNVLKESLRVQKRAPGEYTNDEACPER